MCTGVEIALVGAALASAAATTVTSFQAADAQADAQNAQLQLVYEEQTRLQEENNRIAGEANLDRVRETNQQLGSIRASVGELGGGLDAFVIEAGALEGIDLHRIEKNRKNQEDALQANKRAGHASTLASIQSSYDQAKSTAIQSGFKVAGAGLQLADDYGAFSTEKDPIQ